MDARKQSEGSSPTYPTTAERKSDRELVITRTFDAPARMVFDAWTRPELMTRWWAPRSMGIPILSCDLDVRVGGRYRIVFGKGDGESFAFFGQYLEVTRPSRLVWTNEEGGEGGPISTLTLVEKDGRTLLTLHELHTSKQSLDDNIGVAEGLRETFGQLDELLAAIQG